MITLKARMLILLFLIFVLILIINMVRKRSLELKYVLVWLICDALMIIGVCFPQLLEWIREVLGIYSVTNMIFFIAFLFLLLICFSLTAAISKATGDIHRMAQIVSMIPKDVLDEMIKIESEKETKEKEC